MKDITGLTIVIDGDITGLSNAVEEAQAKIQALSKYTDVGYGGGVYTKAKKHYNHWANSGQSDIDEQIKWWEKAREYFYYDPSVWWESQQRIYDLNRLKTENINSIADDYIRDSKYFSATSPNDSEAINTFKEIAGQNWIFADKGIISWEEYEERVSQLGKEMYEGRVEQSQKWLKTQEKYNNLSVEDYIEGLHRMEEYTEQYFNEGLIDYETYLEGRQNIFDELVSKREEIYTEWQKSASNWKTLRETYGDWEEYGDSIVKFYQRCIEKVSQMYKEGNISWQTYMDDTAQYEMLLFNSQSDAIDSVFSQMSSYISNMQKKFNLEESSLKGSYESSDRQERLSEISKELLIYKNAVTEQGKDKYESLIEEQKQLNREEELYQLESSNNRTILQLQQQYERMENNKNNVLRMIRSSELNLEDITDEIGVNLSLFGGKTEQLLSSIISEIRSAAKTSARTNTSTYTDNKTVNITTSLGSGILPSISNIVTGLGTIMTRG